MRIDVSVAHRDVDAELAALHERLRANESGRIALVPIDGAPPAGPGIQLYRRDHDGETTVYAFDATRRALAGCTVFNRPSEPGVRRHRFLRSPHSRYGTAYQRQGLATAVYSWALRCGLCLISGPRQSEAAHRLWKSLGRGGAVLAVQLDHRQLGPIEAFTAEEIDRLGTRLLLQGAGWTANRIAERLGFDRSPVG
ncbi:N-acetyltransferase [Ramlibacter sp.]|uniref:N-acetyltransferase n=1 Tax=Ramlibacter sp. TaxID=1917967 RepID=UPI003D0D4621